MRSTTTRSARPKSIFSTRSERCSPVPARQERAEILAGARALAQRARARCWLRGEKLPAPAAALVNATMAHSRELDINDDRIAYKSSVAAVPAALALAEKLGGVSGATLSPRFVSASISAFAWA